MVDIGCEVARESLAELALGTLRGEELHRVTEHVEHCKECRHEVTGMLPVASQLLELIPGTEPPLGFERRVLAEVGQSGGATRWAARRRPIVMAVAAAAAVIFGVSGWLAGAGSSGHRPTHVLLAADFVSQGHDVGTIEVYGKPMWLSVTVRGIGVSGPVVCEIVHKDGSVTTMGSFRLADGTGTWASDRPGMTDMSQARLVDTHGQVVAVARFS
ncbi:MAG TPA: zf-HC2 domain-containing protein [Acidimicrobiales bacterium]|nr:zf-HC2 domain-containing protein [Acidimicrobiales bacterium]